MKETLHLVRVPVDSRALFSFATRSGLATRDFDDGYAVHALFAALFDYRADAESRVAPKPFALTDSSGRIVEVLGYARADHAELVSRAKTFGDPAAWQAVDVEGIVSKPMPLTFEVGQRLGFSVRVCPVRRVKKRGNQRDERAEIDVFLAKSFEVNDPTVALDRETVYREWLAQEIGKGGGALESAAMTNFRLGRQHRRTNGPQRRGTSVHHPEAIFRGVLTVQDSVGFAKMLARGVGRHRAFGFGMLLLFPPARA